MSRHSLIGKLCQYQRNHRNKLLFTHEITEQQKAEITYSFLHENSTISARTYVPTWFYFRYHKCDNLDWPEPKNYHVPYIQPDNEFGDEESDKIKTFLVIDTKKFNAKINGFQLFTRTVYKILMVVNDITKVCWVDEEWIEPYAGCETYIDDLKAKMLNKLRQNI